MAKAAHTTPSLSARLAALAGASALSLTATAALAETKTYNTKTGPVAVESIASGLAQPWAVDVLPDGGYIVTELGGNLRTVMDGKVSEPIAGVPKVAVVGQGGLLDVALARDFETSRQLFLSHAAGENGAYGTAIVSARLSEDGRTLEDVKEIFRMNKLTDKGQHFGSRISVAEDGTLFFSIGDRGERNRAQDMRDHAGAVLRINADGTIPADNPYADDKTGLPELWSKGHRNIQGMAIDAADERLVTVEHGARGGDEVNYPEAGKNFGWPVITYGKDYSGAEIGEGTSKAGYEQPAFYWDPSIAPGGMVVYRGEMFPEWKGDLLVAALKYELLSRLDRDDKGEITAEERMLDGEYGRIRDVAVAADGSVLLVTDDENGQLLRLTRPTSN
ncbi:Glucose/arabinose dehydrogenase, beta-propeller fold [Rhizobium sp. RU20A]|uniref:PQQ-dependent sugar dehydrogenase n=1 Tax=Rhizobium sp. RU20A TaxID=1907412 RepID=UPI000953EF82|nr:PQQ-dependent sugar dehydrogenase [Rhizobium sp. RU20A]SIQ25881.1 Glucose/arabinose dehydrogenase, beta-propeller fold [Rhizobium sp. RU20A]